MPSALNVNPKKWSKIVVLFDNGTYSVISGNYLGNHLLGERWNGSGNDLGFPSQGKNPLFNVIPQFMYIHILNGLEQELKKHRNIKKWSKYMKNVLTELENQTKRQIITNQ